jgi:predicted phosphodiesterase
MRKLENKIPGYLEKLIARPHAFAEKKPPLDLGQIQEIHDLFIAQYRRIPNFVKLTTVSENFKDVLIVGDTHGEINSTQRIIKPFLDGKVNSLVFLGDYVDRGIDSFVNLFLLVGMAIAWPERVLLLRGNHEDSYVNAQFDFFSSLQNIFPNPKDTEKAASMIDDIYNHLSLIAITPQGSVCLHGGLPRGIIAGQILTEIPKPHRDIADIKGDQKRQKIQDIFMEIRWNDPTEDKIKDPEAKSYHGFYFFTKGQLSQFLKKNEYKRLIRSHESQRGSFERMFDGMLLHVLSMESQSSSNVSMGYYFGNLKKGLTVHEEPDGTTLLRDLDFNVVSRIDPAQF